MSSFPLATGQSQLVPLSAGVGLSTSATVYTKGAWVQITAGYPMAVSELVIGFYGAAVANVLKFLVDIGIGGSGAEIVIVQDWSVRFLAYDYTQLTVRLAVAIPAGKRIAMRTQCNVSGANVMGVLCSPVFAGPFTPCHSTLCTALGITPASQSGLSVTAGSGTTYGTAVQVSAAVPHSVRHAAISVIASDANYGSTMWQLFRDSAKTKPVGPVVMTQSSGGPDDNRTFGGVVVPTTLRAGDPLYIAALAAAGASAITQVGVHIFG